MSGHSLRRGAPCPACGDLDGCHRWQRRVYIATRLETAELHREVAAELHEKGWALTYNWTVHGSVQSDGIKRIREVALREADGVRTADVVVVLLPGGRGTHAELGLAIGFDKPVVIWSSEEGLLDDSGRTCAFYHHYLVRHVVAREHIAPACLAALEAP